MCKGTQITTSSITQAATVFMSYYMTPFNPPPLPSPLFSLFISLIIKTGLMPNLCFTNRNFKIQNSNPPSNHVLSTYTLCIVFL